MCVPLAPGAQPADHARSVPKACRSAARRISCFAGAQVACIDGQLEPARIPLRAPSAPAPSNNVMTISAITTVGDQQVRATNCLWDGAVLLM